MLLLHPPFFRNSKMPILGRCIKFSWKLKDKREVTWLKLLMCSRVPPLATNRRLKCLQSTFGGHLLFHIINRTFKAKLSFPTLSPLKNTAMFGELTRVAFVSCIKRRTSYCSEPQGSGGGTWVFMFLLFLSISFLSLIFNDHPQDCPQQI